MNFKGRERKRNEKRSAVLKIWTKVHGSSETRWHRFLKTGGTGFWKRVAPVSIGSAGYTHDLPGYSPSFTPFTPLSHPWLRTVKREGEKAIPWRFEGPTMGFKDWSKNLVLQSSGIEFPSVPRLQHLSHHVRRYPMSWFCLIYFSRDYLLDSFGRMASIWS
jgi:hypothetical protein